MLKSAITRLGRMACTAILPILVFGCGGSDSASETPSLSKFAPTAAFGYSANILDYSFNASASADADGTIATYSWDFGDGGTSSGVTATHRYAAKGNYTATLTVTDNSGLPSQKSLVLTAGEVSGGFETAGVGPYTVCTTQAPNYVKAVKTSDEGMANSASGGAQAVKVYWSAASYNGTRMTKGAELCSEALASKEAWIGFMFYLPSTGYPTDKEAGLFQIFAPGGCSSWAAMLIVVNNSLRISHRGNCATAAQTVVVDNIKRDAWIPVVVHMVASQKSQGSLKVWVGDDAVESTPTYSATGINFSFGVWNTDSDLLTSGSEVYFKFGQYDYDTENYTANETRTSYYDNIHIIPAPRGDGWAAVHPKLGPAGF